MSHNYLLDLNKHIEARIDALNQRTVKAEMSPEEYHRNEGRREALKKFQSLLCRHYYPKLPKRLYRRLTENACEAPAPEL